MSCLILTYTNTMQKMPTSATSSATARARKTMNGAVGTLLDGLEDESENTDNIESGDVHSAGCCVSQAANYGEIVNYAHAVYTIIRTYNRVGLIFAHFPPKNC